jgi:hypothetical protein
MLVSTLATYSIITFNKKYWNGAGLYMLVNTTVKISVNLLA